MSNCKDLLEQMLLVKTKEELNRMIQSSTACFNREFLRGAAQAIRDWLKNGEATAQHIWPILEYALSIIGDPILQGDLEAYWADVERIQGMQTFPIHYEKALSFYEKAGSHAKLEQVICLKNLGLAALDDGNLEAAEKWYQQGIEVTQNTGQTGQEAAVFSEMGKMYFKLGQFARAKEKFEKSLALYELIKDPSGIILQKNHIGVIIRNWGFLSEAEQYFHEAVLLSKGTDYAYGLAISLGNLALTYFEQGRVAEAESVQLEARDAIEQTQEVIWKAQWWGNFGLFALKAGLPDQAIDRFTKSLEMHRSVQNKSGEAVETGHLADVYWRKGQIAQADQLYHAALGMAVASRDRDAAANQLIGLGDLAFHQGRLQDAVDAYQSALQIFLDAGQQIDQARCQRLIAGVIAEAGQIEQALELYQTACDLAKNIGDRNQIASILADWAGVLLLIGHAQESIQKFEEALSMFRQMRDRENTAVILSSMAGAYHLTGQIDRTLAVLSEAQTIYEQTGLQSGLVSVYTNLGIVLRSQGKNEEAASYYEQAIQIAERTQNIMGTLEAKISLSAIWSEMGKLDQSQKSFQSVAEEAAQAGLLRVQILAKNNLAFLFLEQGLFSTAEEELKHNLDQAAAAGIPALVIDSLRNLGTLYQAVGFLDEAKEQHQQALNFASQYNLALDTVEALGNLGNLAYIEKDLDQALQLHRLAFDRYQQLGNPRGQAIELINLANIALDERNFEMAMRLSGQALTLSRQIGYLFGQAAAILGQGHIRYLTGDFVVAETCYQQSYQFAKDLQQPEFLRVTCTNLGFVLEKRQQEQAAMNYYREAIAMIENSRINVNGERARISYFSTRIDPYARLAFVEARFGLADQAFVTVEQARNRTFLDLLRRSRTTLTDSKPISGWAEITSLLSLPEDGDQI